MRYLRLSLSLVFLIGVLLIVPGTALAVIFDVPVTLQTAPGYTNEIAMTLAGESGTPSANVATGDYTAQLDVSFDSANAATINSIRFIGDTPGHMSFGSMTFTLYGASIPFNDMMATFSTPGAAVAVTGGAFATTSDSSSTGNRILINGGTFDASALGGPTVDLAVDYPVNQPINSTSGATGTISVGAPYLSGGLNKYDVSLAIPVLFSQDLTTGVPAVVSGTLHGVGSFAVPEPGTVAMLIAVALGLLGWARLRRR
jgi:hypothetical protein